MLKEDGGSGGRKLRELNKVLFVSGVAKEGTGDKESWRDSRAPKMENMVTTNGEKYKMSKSDSGL